MSKKQFSFYLTLTNQSLSLLTLTVVFFLTSPGAWIPIMDRSPAMFTSRICSVANTISWRYPFILNVVVSRVDSFILFFSFAKYETVRNRSLFRRVSIVTKKSVSSFFAKLKKTFRFLVSHIFFKFVTLSSSLIPFIWFSYLLFEFRTFHSTCVSFFRVSYLL